MTQTHAPPVPAAQDAVARAHQHLLQHSDLQFDFPAIVNPKPPEWLEALAKFLVWAAPVLKWVFWILVAILVAAALLLLARQAMRLRFPPSQTKKKERREWPAWRPTPEQARLLLRDADALAAQGRYAEAVHLLLLRSIQDIDERRPRLVRPAFTSREIGRLGALPESARAAFAGIARVVERNRFGGFPVTADDYARCRRDYEQFAFPDQWQLKAVAAR